MKKTSSLQGGNGLKQKPCEVHGSATQCNAVSVVPSPILEGTFGHSDADAPQRTDGRMKKNTQTIRCTRDQWECCKSPKGVRMKGGAGESG